MEVLILCSGGIDSSVALSDAVSRWGKDHVLPLYVDYGSRQMKEEIYAADRVCAHYALTLRVVRLHELSTWLTGALVSGSSEESVTVPGRNAFLLSVGVAIALSHDIPRVWIGVTREDGEEFADCRPAFLTAACSMFSLLGRVAVEAPLLGVTKEQVVSMGVRLGTPLASTYSCYGGEKSPCTTCTPCTRRRNAFAWAGVDASA